MNSASHSGATETVQAQEVETSAFSYARQRGNFADCRSVNRSAAQEARQSASSAEISNSPDSSPAPPAAPILELPTPPRHSVDIKTAPITAAGSPAQDDVVVAPSGPAPTCACGCGATPPRAKTSDKRTGARAGEYQRFFRGHVARLRHKKLQFEDLTPAWLETHIVAKTAGRGDCWLASAAQVTVSGHRVYVARISTLLRDGVPVTLAALDRLQVRGRCRRSLRCINPGHLVVLHELRESEDSIERRKIARAHAEARMAAFRAGT